MTAPVTDWELVLSKFLGAWAFFAFLWLPTLLYVAVLRWYSPLDLGPVASGYLGTLLIGAMFIAIGLLCSALTRNQIIAAVGSYLLVTVIRIVGVFESLVSGEPRSPRGSTSPT